MSDVNEPAPAQEPSTAPARLRRQPAPLLRLAAGGLIVGVTLLALWQAGVLDRGSGSSETASDSGPIYAPRAEVNIDTPNAAGVEVGLRVGDLAPDFRLMDSDRSRVRLSDLRGKVVFLNFWASWCGPCRQEMPDLQAVLDETGSDRMAVFAVNVGESFGTAKRFMDRYELRFTVVAFDPGFDVADRYSVRGLPASYVIDAQGFVSHVYVGQVSRGSMDFAVREALERATAR